MMGLDVYVENQIHERVYAGVEFGVELTKVLADVRDGVLFGVYGHGDTMFNSIHLQMIDAELEALQEVRPDLAQEIASLRDLGQQVVRSRGYLWISGD